MENVNVDQSHKFHGNWATTKFNNSTVNVRLLFEMKNMIQTWHLIQLHSSMFHSGQRQGTSPKAFNTTLYTRTVFIHEGTTVYCTGTNEKSSQHKAISSAVVFVLTNLSLLVHICYKLLWFTSYLSVSWSVLKFLSFLKSHNLTTESSAEVAK